MRYDNVKNSDFICSNENQKQALATAERIQKDAINFVFVGSVGTGKTMLSNIIANSFEKACVTTPAKIARAFRDAFKKDETERQLFDEIESYQMFIIDEIGAHQLSDYEYRLINEIIDHRYEQVLPTGIVSNLDINGIKTVIGDRALDRIKHNGIIQAFNFESQRKQAMA